MNLSNRARTGIDVFREFHGNPETPSIIPVFTPYTFPAAFEGMVVKPLDAWSFPDDSEAFADAQIEVLNHFLTVTEQIDDRYVPALFPFLGIGLNTAFIEGTEMKINGNVSWSPAAIHSWDDLDKLTLDEGSQWMETTIRIATRYAERCDGSYIPATFSHYAASDMASALRGDQLFMDFYDAPDEVARLLQFCVDAATWLEEVLRKTIEQYRAADMPDGTAEGGMWIPGHATFLSEDAADLCSKEIYEEFLAPATERTAAAFGGAFIHHHAAGFHVHERMAKIPDLKVLQIAQDPDRESPLDHIQDLVRWNGGLPLAIECEAAEAVEKVSTIPPSRVVLQLKAGSIDEAREAVAAISTATGG